jgi:hypothetical protein
MNVIVKTIRHVTGRYENHKQRRRMLRGEDATQCTCYIEHNYAMLRSAHVMRYMLHRGYTTQFTMLHSAHAT